MSQIASLPIAFQPAIAPRVLVHPFSVDEYHQMIDTGVLGEDDRIELLEGVVADMPPIGPPHSVIVEDASNALRRLDLPGYCIRSQQPITLARSEPTPDVVLARGSNRDYMTRHPGPREIAILVEVSMSSLDFDRGLKRRIYADAEIPEYWIANLVDRQIEIFRSPRPKQGDFPASYAESSVVPADGNVEVRIDGKVVATIRADSLLA